MNPKFDGPFDKYPFTDPLEREWGMYWEQFKHVQFIYFHTSGKLNAENQDSPFWTLLALAVPAENWKPLQLRINSLQKSFYKANYRPGKTVLKPVNLLKPTVLPRPKTFGLLRGVQRISGQLGLTLFLVVVDKSKAHRPPSSDWVLPLCLRYLERPISQYLAQRKSCGSIVLPSNLEGFSDHFGIFHDRHPISRDEESFPQYNGIHFQSPNEAAGLQVASIAASIARYYHQEVALLLQKGVDLEPHQKCIEDLYQGFVKSNTWVPPVASKEAMPHKGFIYLWRTPQQSGEVDQGNNPGPS
ncbi:MAG: hypothetical protein JJU11_14410 [Candidatus Sumerlaeia bacterium]|nr:hypothetical protein [Candidatus Sumerlaeia bacterium]